MFIFTVQWVKKPDGKELVIVNTHTFYIKHKGKDTLNWSCTSPHCKSRLTTTSDEKPWERRILSLKEKHAHSPPQYVIAHGFYVKL